MIVSDKVSPLVIANAGFLDSDGFNVCQVVFDHIPSGLKQADGCKEFGMFPRSLLLLKSLLILDCDLPAR